MAQLNVTQLKHKINQLITTNGNGEIEGAQVNELLRDFVDSMGLANDPRSVVGTDDSIYSIKTDIPLGLLSKGLRTREFIGDNFTDYMWNGIEWLNFEAVKSYTYSDLAQIQSDGRLTPGRFYIIADYQCKYLIPYTKSEDLSGFGVSAGDTVQDANGNIVCSPAGVVNTEAYNGQFYGDMLEAENNEVNTEQIMVQAKSESSFFKEAFSVDYAEEKLFYDFNNNTFKDGLDNEISRTGWVEHRWNARQNIVVRLNTPGEKGGDYRYVKFRRWKIDFDNSYSANPSLPSLATGGMQEEQLYCIPKPDFQCGVKPLDFDFGTSMPEDVYTNNVIITDIVEFKDYLAFPDPNTQSSLKNIDVSLDNTVLKSSNNGAFYFPGMLNFSIHSSQNSTIGLNFARNIDIGTFDNSIHIYNSTGNYYSHYGFYSKGYINGCLFFNYLQGEIDGRSTVQHSIFSGQTIRLKIVRYITSSIIQNFSGTVTYSSGCFVQLGNMNYRFENHKWCELENLRDSLIISETTNQLVKLGDIKDCEFYLMGDDVIINKANTISIGSNGSPKDLSGCKVLVPITQSLNSSAIIDKVVTMKSPDNHAWYNEVNNSGDITAIKLI